jgi:hypothetical protein
VSVDFVDMIEEREGALTLRIVLENGLPKKLTSRKQHLLVHLSTPVLSSHSVSFESFEMMHFMGLRDKRFLP